MNKKNILTIIILSTYWFCIYNISWIWWLIKFIWSLIIYTLIFYLFHYIKAKITKKYLMYFNNFIEYFLNRVAIFLLFITVLLWWLSYISNEVYPAPMPEYTITNWNKTVVFQAMSHIWTRNFYDTIIKNITDHKKEWWVYFFEWVKLWTEENNNKFNKALWINFDKDLYKNFSKLYWVTNQDNSEFLWLVNNLDFNVDLNMDEIIKSYEEKISTNSWITKQKIEIPIDINKQIVNTLTSLNPKELKIIVYINQAILNFIIQNKATQNFLTDNFTNIDLFDVILDKRNENLANSIIKSKYNNIYITYWLLHFEWVLKLLKENDKNWKIIETKNLYPIKNEN